jgi:hypothetical protein
MHVVPRIAPRLAHVLALAFAVIPLAGCDDGPPQGTKEEEAPKGPPPQASRPGYAVGRAITEAGTPIAAPGAKVHVYLGGVAAASGERVQYSPAVKPDGTYAQKLVDGTYAFEVARVEVPFEGAKYYFDLEPVGDDHATREASEGPVQDYVWRLTGLRPGRRAGSTVPGDWYGAVLRLRPSMYRNDVKRAVPAPEAGTRYEFSLEPISKQVDGAEGKARTWTLAWNAERGEVEPANPPDLPPARYRLRGKVVRPDGSTTRLLFAVDWKTNVPEREVSFPPASPRDGVQSADVEFVPDE